MAIVRSLAIGKAIKSAGNLTYQTVKGRTIAREKPTFVANPNTERQQAQRAKLRTMVEAWRAWFSVLKPFFTVIQGYGSAYNEFVSRNINLPRSTFFESDTDNVSMRGGIVMSTGKYGAGAVHFEKNEANIDVTIPDFQLRGDMQVGDRLIIVSQAIDEEPLPKVTEHDLTQGNIDTLAAGETLSIPSPSLGDLVYYTVFFYSSARRIASVGITSGDSFP